MIAVEVHQFDNMSSDLSFDLELTGKALPAATPKGFLRGDANGDGQVGISDVLKILFYLFAGDTSDCPDSLDADDSGVVGIPDALRIVDYLFLGGPGPFGPLPRGGPGFHARRPRL